MNPATPVIDAIHDLTHGPLGSPRARAILPPLEELSETRRVHVTCTINEKKGRRVYRSFSLNLLSHSRKVISKS